MKLALTGIMGSGKSSAGKSLQAHGFERLDSDQLVRGLLQSDKAVIAAIREQFGDPVFAADASINRSALAKAVFQDEQALQTLESILHPRVRSLWQQQLAARPDGLWCVEIPLLFEKKLEIHFDYTVCIAASEAVCLARLAAKGFSTEDARARMARQLPLCEKIRRADYVISNDGSFEFLDAQIKHLVNTLAA